MPEGGKHRWVKDDAEFLTCHDCGQQRKVGPALRCRFAQHLWGASRTPTGEAFHECLYCRKLAPSYDTFWGAAPPGAN